MIPYANRFEISKDVNRYQIPKLFGNFFPNGANGQFFSGLLPFLNSESNFWVGYYDKNVNFSPLPLKVRLYIYKGDF